MNVDGYAEPDVPLPDGDERLSSTPVHIDVPVSSEGSPFVPQQPVERWTIWVCEDCRSLAHNPGDRCNADRRRTWTPMASVEVVPALVADRLAAALGSALGYISADIDSGDPPTDQAWRICQDGKVALQAFESGGATNAD